MVAPLVSFIYKLGWVDKTYNYLWIFDEPKILFYSVLFYPIIEELSFRGVIQGILKSFTILQKDFLGISFANILTSILFALMHTVYHSPIWAILIFFPSLVFGYFRDITGGVKVSIFLHMFYNFCFLLIVGW